MKKILFAASFLLITLGLVSCGSSSSNTDTTEFTITGGQWTSSGTPGSANYIYYHSHSISDITSNIVSNGAVLCYIKLIGGANDQYAAMPYVETYSGYTVTYGFQYEVGTLFITRKDSDLNTIAPSGSITIKCVVVGAKDMELIDGVDVNNYLEVAEALNLEK